MSCGGGEKGCFSNPNLGKFSMAPQLSRGPGQSSAPVHCWRLLATGEAQDRRVSSEVLAEVTWAWPGLKTELGSKACSLEAGLNHPLGWSTCQYPTWARLAWSAGTLSLLALFIIHTSLVETQPAEPLLESFPGLPVPSVIRLCSHKRALLCIISLLASPCFGLQCYLPFVLPS